MTALLILAALLQGDSIDSPFGLAQDKQDKGFATTKEAMQKVQLVVGEWTGTGVPENTKDAAWTEKCSCTFKIDKEKNEYALVFTYAEGRLMKEGVLSYDLKRKIYRFDLTRPDGSKRAYEGKLADTTLTLEQPAEKDAQSERLEWNLLRDNNYFINVEMRKAGAKSWEQTHNVRFRKEGVPFVRGEGPKCVVTGGMGSIAVSYKDKTYYVC